MKTNHQLDLSSERLEILSFQQYLAEKLDVPNLEYGLKKRRHTLPQLKNFDAFKDDLKANDIAISEPKKVDPDDYAPTQSNFKEEKVDAMVENGTWNNNPIIVSKDQYVIDGHHRWLAACKVNKNVSARIVDLTADEILTFLKDKDYVEKHTINQ